ncbi:MULTISPECIES: lytic transglycosylase domain-containing protein [Bradyrhizobium]|uniref:lytic transglycosylase domain-containing protein n=1 Tax=Bradyrhizobium elkanii TaxID=29448 RepID=UPI00042538D6|nr:transglycosylase SLT domain-containing protein [Bradyrhizobium elkanii]
MRGHRQTRLSRGWLLALATGVGLALTSALAFADTSPAAAEESPAAAAASEPEKEAAPAEAAPAKEAAPAETPSAIERRWRENAKVGLPPTRGGATSTSSAQPRSRYRELIEKQTAGTGLAPEIAEAVMGVESGYNAGAIGGVGEIGLMQVLPSTARMLGFTGTNAELAVPETNIRYGVTYLAQAWRLARGDLCTAVMKYRAGHGETRFSHLSVSYCLAVRSRLMARGFQVTGSVPVATFGEPARGGGGGGGGCKRRCLAGLGGPNINYANLNARLSALVVQVRGGK